MNYHKYVQLLLMILWSQIIVAYPPARSIIKTLAPQTVMVYSSAGGSQHLANGYQQRSELSVYDGDIAPHPSYAHLHGKLPDHLSSQPSNVVRVQINREPALLPNQQHKYIANIEGHDGGYDTDRVRYVDNESDEEVVVIDRGDDSHVIDRAAEWYSIHQKWNSNQHRSSSSDEETILITRQKKMKSDQQSSSESTDKSTSSSSSSSSPDHHHHHRKHIRPYFPCKNGTMPQKPYFPARQHPCQYDDEEAVNKKDKVMSMVHGVRGAFDERKRIIGHDENIFRSSSDEETSAIELNRKTPHHSQMPAIGRGELALTDDDIDEMYAAMENGELFMVYSIIKDRLELVSNETKALLQFFANRFSTEERAAIWKMLAQKRYIAVHNAIKQKINNLLDDNNDRVKQTVEILKNKFAQLLGRKLVEPTSDDMFFEVQTTIMTICIIIM